MPGLTASGAFLVAAFLLVWAIPAPRVWAQEEGVDADAGTEAPDAPDAGEETESGDDERPGGDNTEEPPPPTPSALTPPRLLTSSPPLYPPNRAGEGLHPTVTLVVTIDGHGQVVEAVVEHSADPDFDEAARAAVQGWTFEPARRGDAPIAARVRVAVHFEVPSFDLVTTTESIEPDTDTDTDTDGGGEAARAEEPDDVASSEGDEAVAEPLVEEEEELSVVAHVEAPPPHHEDRSAGSFEIGRDILAAAPRQEGADMLLSVPGVYVARAEGMAVGQRISLRGFDAEHGQDIELRVGGLPINLPSHIHGQGYADLGLLIPEAVQRVRATEGVYDPRQGDFAVAGTINFDLGANGRHRGWRLASGYGQYNTFRQLVMWAPEGERDETLGAVQFRHSDGFGQNRSGDAVSAIVQAGGRSGSWRLRGLGILYGARADLAGVLRVEDIDAGRVGYYDSYPQATAQSQNAFSGRLIGGFFGDYRGENGANGGLGLWVGADVFRLQENFTGFIQRSRTLSGVAGRGDLIEQRNQTISAGLTGRYRTPPWRPWDWLGARMELGLDGRVDFIEQAQNLLGSPRNQTWDRRVDASVFGTQASLWGDVEVLIGRYVRVHAGLRSALLLYDVDDRLGNFVTTVRPADTFIMGFRRTAGGVTVGPRASAEVKPLEWLSIRAAYGEGYRSPQARTLEDAERAPFTVVRSADLGAVFELERYLRVTVAGYWTELSDDIAFEPREGRLERLGASRRLGAVLYAQARPVDWFVGALSVTYVDAELLEPPPPTADNPQPPFVPGQNLPYIAPVVIRADVGAHGTLLEDLFGEELRGRIGVGYSFLSPRPLPFGGFADPVNLLDASASLGWGPVDLGISLFNLFDSRYAASQFMFTSNWDPEGIPRRLPAAHIAAGSPFRFMLTLGVSP